MNNFIKVMFGKTWFWLAALALAALAARFFIASLLPAYIFDESVSAAIAEKPLAQIWTSLKYEMHPPLYYYSLHFWFDLFGSSEFTARSFSIILSLLAVFALYFLGREIFSSKRAALAAAFFYALSILFCFYGVLARMYSMLFLFSSLSSLFFLKLLKARGSSAFRPAILFSIFTLAALYAHLTGALAVLAELSYLGYCLFKKKYGWRELLKKFLAPFSFLALIYGPWLVFFLVKRYFGIESSAWYFSSQGGDPAILIFINYLLIFLSVLVDYIPGLLAFSIIAILGAPVFFKLEKGGRFGWRIKRAGSAGGFFALLILIISFFALALAGLFNLRYAAVPAIGFFLILGRGFSLVRKPFKILVLLLFAVIFLLSSLSLSGARPVEDWREVSDFISQNERPDDVIFCSLYCQLLPLERYYRGRLPILAPLDEKYKKENFLATVIYSNIYPTTNVENVSQFDDSLAVANRVFLLVSGGTFPQNFFITRDHLLESGFSWSRQRVNAEDNSLKVFVFERAGAR